MKVSQNNYFYHASSVDPAMMNAGHPRLSQDSMNLAHLPLRSAPKRPMSVIVESKEGTCQHPKWLSRWSIREENGVLPLEQKKSFKNSACLEEKTNDDQKLQTTAPSSPTLSNIDMKSQSPRKNSTMPPPLLPPSPLIVVTMNGSAFMNHADNQEKN